MSEIDHLRELRNQKTRLRSEISDMEDIITFKSKKESLSVLTNGLTDSFLKESVDEYGETSLSLDTKRIMSGISSQIKETASRSNMIGFANDSVNSGLLENSLKMGVAAMVSNYARKNMKNKSWKNKAIGMALVYVAPYALRMISNKLDNYQKEKTTSSLEKLI